MLVRRIGIPNAERYLYLEIRVPFELATSGGKMQFSYQRKVICKHCNGNGTEPGSKSQTCPNCNGTGTVSSGLGGFVVNRPCPQCLGRGTIISNPCKVCGGAGSINETRTLAIPLKPGTEDGKKIKLRNQGHFGKGDLILAVRIEEHKFFKRKGLDVYCEVPVNIVQAALGTKIRVKTINDKKVELNVPEGTQNGTVLKLRGLGLSKDNQKGDQYVTIRVETPSNLSEEQKELLRKFQKASK